MSYTAPQYVDTKEQAVLALASVIADEDKSALGDGSVNKALDVLADVLAKQDVSVPQTNAGAILALAQYVTGGGGSQADILFDEDVLFDYTPADPIKGFPPRCEYSATVSEFTFSDFDVVTVTLDEFCYYNSAWSDDAQLVIEGFFPPIESPELDFSATLTQSTHTIATSLSTQSSIASEEYDAWAASRHRLTVKKINLREI